MTLATLHQALGSLLALGAPGSSQVGRWDLTGQVPVWVPLGHAVEVELDDVPHVEVGP